MPSVRSALAVAGALIALAAPAAARAGTSCTPTDYSYAGLTALAPAYGVAATLEATAAPWVTDGHVAAWVGVGGPGYGPHGEDEWLQAGMDALPGLPGALYYEVAQPGAPIEYGALADDALVGERHRVAILELERHPGFWQVWVDGRPAAGPFYLPGSDGDWSPLATAESWGAGSACNRFSYRFDGVSLAHRPGGSWHRLHAASAFADRGYRVIRRSRASFTALAQTTT
jgi:hypothetical protein